MMTLPPTVSQAAYDYALRGARIRAQWYWKQKAAHIDREDLETAALLAVWRATKTFKPSKGVLFTSYAWRGVQMGLNREQTRWRNVSASRLQDLLAGRVDPEPQDYRPECYHLLPEWVRDGREAEDDTEGEVVERVWAGEVRALVEQLEPEERDLIVARFWGGKTLAEVGAQYGLTREGARYRQEGILTKLRTMLEAANG